MLLLNSQVVFLKELVVLTQNLYVEPIIFLTGRSVFHSIDISVPPCPLNAKFAVLYLSKFIFRACLVAQMVKNLLPMWRPGFDPWLGRSPGGGYGNPPGESPRTEGPGGLQSMGWQRVEHNLVTKHSTNLYL